MVIIRRKGIDKLVSVDVILPQDENWVVENAEKKLGENYDIEVWRRDILERT